MTVKVVTKEDKDAFNSALWDAAHATPPEFVFAIYLRIADHIEIKEDGQAMIVFKEEFQKVQEEKNDD